MDKISNNSISLSLEQYMIYYRSLYRLSEILQEVDYIELFVRSFYRMVRNGIFSWSRVSVVSVRRWVAIRCKLFIENTKCFVRPSCLLLYEIQPLYVVYWVFFLSVMQDAMTWKLFIEYSECFVRLSSGMLLHAISSLSTLNVLFVRHAGCYTKCNRFIEYTECFVCSWGAIR